MYVIYSFFVPDLPCINCAQSIKDALTACSELEIDDISFDATTKKMSIRIPESLSDRFLRQTITKVLSASRYTPVFSDTLSLKAETRRHWIYGAIGSISGIALLIFTLFFGALPLMWMVLLSLASSALTLWLGYDSYKRAWAEWRNLLFGREKKSDTRLSMDSLFAVSTTVVLIVSLVSFFVPWLPMMLDTGLLIFGFRHLGLGIEGSLKRAMRFDIRFVDRLPKTVRVRAVNGIEEQLLKSIQPGAILEVLPGEIIPLDGDCLNENQLIYEDIITGAYLPREIKANEKLLSGMRVARGGEPLLLKVTKPFTTSYLKYRDQQLEKAVFEKSADFEKTASKILHYFIPAVFALALISAGVVACFFPWAIAIRCAIAVLVSACPCTLGLVVPLAVKIAMQKAADHGVQFRSAEQLQRAGEVDCVVLDLNGTLTTGVPVVAHQPVFVESLINEVEFFQAIVTLEKQSEHPIGRALYDYAKQQVPRQVEMKTAVQRQHFGVSASIDGREYALGNRSMMNALGIDLSSMPIKVPLKAGNSLVYLARDKQIMGYVVVTDPLRKDAALLVNSLKKLGKKIFICTGADLATAERAADELHITRENVRASQRCSFDSNDSNDSKDDKSLFIKELQKKGHCVAMVGDAGNDALAIATSDFGLAVGSKGRDEMARSKAGADVHDTSLLPVITAFMVSKQAVSNITQNLAMSLSYNLGTELLVGGILVALGVMLNPSIGVALMIGQMCLILGNAYRFKQQSLPHLVPSKENTESPGDSAGYCTRLLGKPGPTKTYSLNHENAMVSPPLWANDARSPQYPVYSVPHVAYGREP